MHECPNYANTGQCGNKKCPLPHIDRAGQIRKLAANKAGDHNQDDEDESDLSSEEEMYDEIDTDDVDSDDLDEEEEIVQGAESSEIAQQQDFIRF